MPGKPISKSKNAGLAKLAKSGDKGRALAKKFGYNPDRMTAKKGGYMKSKMKKKKK